MPIRTTTDSRGLCRTSPAERRAGGGKRCGSAEPARAGRPSGARGVHVQGQRCQLWPCPGRHWRGARHGQGHRQPVSRPHSSSARRWRCYRFSGPHRHHRHFCRSAQGARSLIGRQDGEPEKREAGRCGGSRGGLGILLTGAGIAPVSSQRARHLLQTPVAGLAGRRQQKSPWQRCQGLFAGGLKVRPVQRSVRSPRTRPWGSGPRRRRCGHARPFRQTPGPAVRWRRWSPGAAR